MSIDTKGPLYFCIRKKSAERTYWSATYGWIDNIWIAAVVSAKQKQSFALPAEGEFVPLQFDGPINESW